ncbi:MAG: tetratricopeptide repeat protein, partial [Candidatus Aegiribacteria sp.]|nr:tetratricopeptide repeat protein [Candidatus Aegiribacteria sp.]
REDLGDVKGTASTLGNLGNLHEKLEENESALECFSRSLELYEELPTYAVVSAGYTPP